MAPQDRERTELRFELTVAERAARNRANVRHRYTMEQQNGIDEFEKNMKRMGSGPKSPRELTSADFQGVDYEPPYQMTQRLTQKFEEDHKPAEVVGYYQDVKAKISADRIARRERQTRRRKMMVDQARSQAGVEATRAQQQRINKLLEEGKAQRLAASQMWRQQYEEKRRERQMLARLDEQDAKIEEGFLRTLSRDRQHYRTLRAQRVRRLRHCVSCCRVSDLAATPLRFGRCANPASLDFVGDCRRAFRRHPCHHRGHR